MAENEINNNLILEKRRRKEEEKKTKKNKLYSTLAITIIAIGAGVGLGAYFSLHKNHNSTPTPIISVINLNELNLNTKIDAIVQDSEMAFNLFINDDNNIKNYPDLKDNVEIGTFNLNWGSTATTLEIKAKTNTNYTGTIKINFLGQKQINLNTLNQNTIDGTENMTEEDAWEAFIANNSNITNLEQYIDITKFNVPKYGTNGEGSLVITAKTMINNKYTGTITVNINALKQININNLGLNTTPIEYTNNMLIDDAFSKFSNNNSGKIPNDLKNNINLTMIQPTYTNPGSLTITANENSKYTGTMTIKINVIDQIDITKLGLNISTAIIGIENMNTNDAWNAFITNNNSNIIPNDLRANVNLNIKTPTYTNPGSLTITGTGNKYTGSIIVTISQLVKTELSSLFLNTWLSEAYTNQSDAFIAFIDSNPQISDLANNVQVSAFTPSNYGTTGSLVITAIQNSKYIGTIIVDITAINQTNLNILNTNAIDGIENMTEQDAWKSFLVNNNTITDLEQYVNITNFDAPDYNKNGSLTISAKQMANNKYIGSITISINTIKTTDINSLNLIRNIDGTVAMFDDDYLPEQALQIFLNANYAQYPDLKDNINLTSINLPNLINTGSLTIDGINKYTGTITITINKIIVTDQDIVDTVQQLNINFDAYKEYNQSLNNFISVVLHGEGNPDNLDNDPLWYIRGQFEKHRYDSWILRYVDLNKYQFIQFCVKDTNHTPLTDAYLKSHYQPGDTAIVQVNFNYGNVTNQYIDFRLTLK